MSNNINISAFIANDNSPDHLAPRGDAAGFNAALKERHFARIQNQSSALDDNQPRGIFWISLCLWAAFLCGLAWTFYTSQSVNTRIFASVGVIWTGLWGRYVTLDHQNNRLAEICLLSTLIGFVALLTTGAVQLGYPLTLPAGLCLFAAISLALSWLHTSKIALMAAICSALIWAGLQMDGYITSGAYNLIIPALWAGMVLQSVRLRSSLGIFASTLISYVWLIGSAAIALSSGDLSLLYFCAGASVIGWLHMKVAKAAEDEGITGVSIHVLIGWIMGMCGLTGVAYYALNPQTDLWAGSQFLLPEVRFGWAMVMICALGIIFFAGLIRRKNKRTSMAGVFMNTILLAIIPAGLWFEVNLQNAFLQWTDTPLYPSLGVFLFGVIGFQIAFFVFNAIRRNQYLIAILAMCISLPVAKLAATIDLSDLDTVLNWGFGFVTALILTLLAAEPQINASRKTHRPRYRTGGKI